MNIKWLFLIIYLLSIGPLIAETLYFNRPIDSIKFSGFTSSVANDAIHAILLQTLPNSLLSTKKLKSDIKTIYQTGYFSKVTVQSDVIHNKHILVFHVDEHLPITHLDITTNSNRVKRIMTHEFSSLLDSPLNALKLEKSKQSVLSTLHKAGFHFITLEDIVYDKPSQTLRIISSEASIESINFVGLNTINPSILLRYMSQSNGVVFNSLDLRKDRERLLRLGYFSTISSPQFSKGSSPHLIKITFNVIEKKLNKISVGLEQDQIRYYGFISKRRHNTFINSDLITVKTQIQYTKSTLNLDRYSIGYTQPWIFNRYNLSGSISYYNLEKQEVLNKQTTRSLRKGQKFGLTIPLSPNFFVNTSLKFENISPLFASDAVSSYSIHSCEMALIYETLNNSLNPDNGSRFYFNIEQGNTLGFITLGGLSFTRLSSSIVHYIPLHSKLIFASRLQGGIFYPIQESIHTFENDYFILGGSRSIRGYNESTSPFTGRRHVLINTELRYSLLSQFQSVFFIDYGNAFNRHLILSNFNMGYGIGFRFHTPIGPIRLDFAQGYSSFYIHFGLGHVF